MNNQTVTEICKGRKLPKCIISLQILSVQIKVNNNKQNVYPVYGIDLQGFKFFIDYFVDDEDTKTSNWYTFFQTFKRRGNEVILYAMVPKMTKAKEGLKVAYPGIEVFYSADYLLGKMLNYTSYRESSGLSKIVRTVYFSESIDSFTNEYETIKFNYQDAVFVLDTIKTTMKDCEDFYKHSLALRKMIYSYNFMRWAQVRLKRYQQINYNSVKEFMDNVYFNRVKATENKIYVEKKILVAAVSEIYAEKKELVGQYIA